jgi:Lon protease-like protein
VVSIEVFNNLHRIIRSVTNFIPIFPLAVVVYPGEELNLHIFEPRYKQLIKECHAAQKPFGIPVVLNKKLQEFGTMVEITSMVKEYENGEMDIKTKGAKVFRILELIRDIPDKLYGGAIVNYPDNYTEGNAVMMRKLMKTIKELHKLLHVTKDFKKETGELKSYDVAHHVGMTIEEEYDLLCLQDERQRLEFLKRYLARAIPMMTGMEQLKERIKLNGHFKNLEGFGI